MSAYAVAAPFVATQQFASTQRSATSSSSSFSATAGARPSTAPANNAFATQSLNAYYASHGVPAPAAASALAPAAMSASGSAAALPASASWSRPARRDQFVEQYYTKPGPDYSVPDYNSYRGVPGLNYRFPNLHQNTITRHSEATWSSGRAPWAYHQSPSTEGGKPAPFTVRIVPPTVAPPTGSTQRFREYKSHSNGQYLGPEVLADATDFRPQTPALVSHSPVVNRGATRFDAARTAPLVNDPYPAQLVKPAGSMFTHYARREFKQSR